MGKIGGSSWLTAVKKAFRSPSKENDKRTSRRREEHEQDEEEKKRGKRRWIFRKPSNHHETIIQHSEARNITTITNSTTTTTAINEVKNPISETTDAEEQQRHAVAVAMATTAAAEAAVATAQAAVEFIRLTRPSIFLREHYAAIVVQTIFRGYLARRALRALKGLVKLQALVRGYNVRKRAKKTLQCMQSLVRVQTRVRDQRRRLSHEGSFDSMLSNPSSLWEDRKSISRDGSNVTGEWEDHTVEEIHAMLEKTKETAFIKREKALAYAFSHQMWRSGRESYASEEEPEKPRWTNGQWENTRRTSCDQRDPIRTVEIDTSRPYSYTPNVRRAQYQHHHYQQQIPSSHYASSPLHRAYQNQYLNSPITPPPLKAKPLQMHSASPRCLREERNYPTAQTPNLGSTYYHGIRGGAGTTAVPNYMAATASAKARVRSHSAPRQRPSTPEREKTGSAKKRLYFPVPDSYSGNEGNGGHRGMEQRSNMSSCCTESLGDDISPSSTYDLRRWLR